MQVHMSLSIMKGLHQRVGGVCILTRMADMINDLLVLHAIYINSHNTRQGMKRKIQDNIK